MSNRMRGFTLIELLVTVATISVLAALAIPQFASYQQRAFDSRSVSDLRNAATGEEAYFADYRRYVDCVGGAACQASLPGFLWSSGVDLAMFEVPAAGGVPEHFTGRAFHPRGTRSSLGQAFMWNSQTGGLQ